MGCGIVVVYHSLAVEVAVMHCVIAVVRDLVVQKSAADFVFLVFVDPVVVVVVVVFGPDSIPVDFVPVAVSCLVVLADALS